LKSLLAQQQGVSVVAAADGQVSRIRDGVPDTSVRVTGKESVRNRECGNGVVVTHLEGWETQYCHMAKGSLSVKPGQKVKAGDKLGEVGLSGLTEYPHLHFTLRHNGKIVDPFSYRAAAGTCGADAVSLWDPDLSRKLTYQPRTVLNAGFTNSGVSMDMIESGKAETTQVVDSSAAIVAFVRAIGLKAGDVQSLTLMDPSGRVIAENKVRPLEKDMAQNMIFAGRKKPENGWEQGVYAAKYAVEKNGEVVLEQHLQLELR
jgi:hypothetical protein